MFGRTCDTRASEPARSDARGASAKGVAAWCREKLDGSIVLTKESRGLPEVSSFRSFRSFPLGSFPFRSDTPRLPAYSSLFGLSWLSWLSLSSFLPSLILRSGRSVTRSWGLVQRAGRRRRAWEVVGNVETKAVDGITCSAMRISARRDRRL